MTHIPIPIGTHYTSMVAGSAFRAVKCENCQSTYIYYKASLTSGVGTSLLFADNEGARQRAETRANEALKRSLEKEVDPIPCPACGWYQQRMVERLREEQYAWMLVTCLVLFVAFVVLLLVAWLSFALNANPPPWTPAVLFAGLLTGACSFAAYVGKKIRSSQFDPNSTDIEERKNAGKSRAMLQEQAEKLTPEGLHEAFLKLVKPEQSRFTKEIEALANSGTRTGRVFWAIVGAVCLGLSFWLIPAGANDILLGTGSVNWPRTDGTIIRSLPVEVRRGTRWDREGIEIKYAYAVDGVEFISDRLWFGAGQQAEENLARYRPGQKVTVYYDPSHPSMAVLVPGPSYVRLSGGIIALIGCIGMWRYCFVLHRRLRPEDCAGEGR
jgi:hypothetical protein